MKENNIPAVVIGMDPHKRTATIEVMAGEEVVVGGGRFTTDTDGLGFPSYRRDIAFEELSGDDGEVSEVR